MGCPDVRVPQAGPGWKQLRVGSETEARAAVSTPVDMETEAGGCRMGREDGTHGRWLESKPSRALECHSEAQSLKYSKFAYTLQWHKAHPLKASGHYHRCLLVYSQGGMAAIILS